MTRQIGIWALASILGAVIGFLIPQNLGHAERLQGLFWLAQQEYEKYEECRVTAMGNFGVAGVAVPEKCESIERVRDIYDGITLPEAQQAFKRDTFFEQAVFAATFSFLFMLTAVLYTAKNRLRRRLKELGVN